MAFWSMKRGEGRSSTYDTDSNEPLPTLWLCERRSDAHRRLPDLLPLRELWCHAATDRPKLLRLLLLQRPEMSTEAAGVVHLLGRHSLLGCRGEQYNEAKF